ncbi:MAG: adenine phosphoribosyltransferase [Candidatus Scalindua sp. AMX11]|nr:MAG: adenine phosphoribosyltransferase [Candidatus Scalindua sp.]NOG83304.1 adenine phosphoribosyltransferase [Planctomycetota bacterium]RZV76796.1 MAG: adenine phosphoribosyltransferase [Candidatus Scalindua sp. SCAELEC01]TDE63449.1 MAG: adenine phosphoribosyltransferase [Candidatus Scalindua sp. AMX11]GJQ57480.1 MAG: adenine phosphoribosyltransferase [Candidatus Scalindua sp.]
MLKELVRDVPDFPKEGIIFKDITPLFRNPSSLKETIDKISDRYAGQKIDVVVGTEARGFLIGPAIAMKLNAGFVPIRKPGKLPCETATMTYELEYGSDTVEMHKDAISNNDSVLMVDDLLATGGTMAASCDLVESLGGKIVGCAFIIELGFLNGKEKLGKFDVFSLLHY